MRGALVAGDGYLLDLQSLEPSKPKSGETRPTSTAVLSHRTRQSCHTFTRWRDVEDQEFGTVQDSPGPALRYTKLTLGIPWFKVTDMPVNGHFGFQLWQAVQKDRQGS